MREYYLQDTEYRRTVDLTNYKKLIEDAVHDVSPTTKVEVFTDHYTISPDLSKGDVIKIGRNLAQTDKLGQYCIIRSLLFKGEQVKESSSTLKLKEKINWEQKDINKHQKKGRCR